MKLKITTKINPRKEMKIESRRTDNTSAKKGKPESMKKSKYKLCKLIHYLYRRTKGKTKAEKEKKLIKTNKTPLT